MLGEVIHNFHRISLPLPRNPLPLSYYGCLPNRGKKTPFQWKFTRKDLDILLEKLQDHKDALRPAA